jgi:NADPH-dependent ferric siderophore reductase
MAASAWWSTGSCRITPETTKTMPLRAEATVATRDPAGLLARTADHLARHGREEPAPPGRRAIAFSFATVALDIDANRITLSAEAEDMDALLRARASLASHLLEFADGEDLAIVWRGDGAEVTAPPSYRELTVTEVETLTPKMRRVHFAASDLGRFASPGNIHVKLAFPSPGEALPAPRLGPSGLTVWPESGPQPVWRKYTIRRIDAARGSLVIDFVLHDDHGPGSAWAASAKPGARIGLTGPGGLGLVPARWNLFIADETGLPAVGRMLEAMSPEGTGEVILSVADPAEIQQLVQPPGVQVTWLPRSTAKRSLVEAATAVVIPDHGDVHVWAAAEFAVFKALRGHFRDTVSLAPERQLIVSYWRRGAAEG